MTETLADGAVRVLDHGFVRLDEAMASDLSVANAARVSFARRKDAIDEADEGLIRFLLRERHGTPFEHNAFRFHVRCPIFVAREWFRHRIGCLAGDTVVTFVNCDGASAPRLRKTMEELWLMWSEGERDGHALPEPTALEVDRLAAEGLGQREIARRLDVGRRAVRSRLAGANGMRDARWRFRHMRVRVLDEDTGEFGEGRIAAVVEKGVQPVYELRLADGKTLRLTENHRVLTSTGWATMRDAVGLVGSGPAARMTRSCAIQTNGVPAHRDRAWLEERRRAGLSVTEIAAEAGCSYHTVRKWLGIHGLRFTKEEQYSGRRAWNKGRRGDKTRLRHSPEHLAAIRGARSGAKSNFWRGGVTSERAAVAAWATSRAPSVHAQFDYTCQQCGTRGVSLFAHHLFPVWHSPDLARDVGNLVSVCGPCHRAIHRTPATELAFAAAKRELRGRAVEQPEFRKTGYKLVAHPVEVASVRYVGLVPTYDLCIDGPWHNFVANGMVVHNSFNEFSMRYAKATDEFYVPAPEDVRTQVGKPGAYSFEPVDDALAAHAREELARVYEEAFATYERLVEAGVARELARAVMPVGAYTEFYWTVNARALMNFVSLRAAETAQREIRRYAEVVEGFLAERMPVTHAAFVENGRTAP